MKKINKFVLVLLFIFNLTLLSSCSINGVVYSEHPTYEVSFTKQYFTSTIDELENLIPTQESLYDAELKFYYNLDFLEKYNWTTTPDYNNKNEYIYTLYNSLSETYSTLFFTTSQYVSLGNPLKYNNFFSTQVSYLNLIGKDSYYYQYEEPNYSSSYYHFRFLNEETNQFNYGITYQARSIEPIFLYKDNQTRDEYYERVETPNVKICPNLMVPSFENIEPDENGFYSYPVVYLEEYENITIACRIYIDSYPIDCLIRFKYLDKINSIEQLKELSKNKDTYDLIEKRYYCSDTYEHYSNCFNYVFEDEINLLHDFTYEVQFISFYNKYGSNIAFKKPYLHNYIDELDEYFTTFIDGAEEISINYRVKE